MQRFLFLLCTNMMVRMARKPCSPPCDNSTAAILFAGHAHEGVENAPRRTYPHQFASVDESMLLRAITPGLWYRVDVYIKTSQVHGDRTSCRHRTNPRYDYRFTCKAIPRTSVDLSQLWMKQLSKSRTRDVTRPSFLGHNAFDAIQTGTPLPENQPAAPQVWRNLYRQLSQIRERIEMFD